MTRKPWSHARILIYQTWAFCDVNHQEASNINCSTVFFIFDVFLPFMTSLLCQLPMVLFAFVLVMLICDKKYKTL